DFWHSQQSRQRYQTGAPAESEWPCWIELLRRPKLRPQERRPRRILLPMAFSVFAIRKSSSLCPERRAATSQRGCLPRPDHVSVGTDGLLYLGRIFGYSRRARSPFASGLASLP